MEFKSKRLIYRLYTQEDFEFLSTMLSDSEMVRFIGNGSIRDEQGAIKFLEWIFNHYQMNKEYGLKILAGKEDNVVVSHAGISLIQPMNYASRKVATKNGMKLEEETVLNDQNVCIYSK